VSDQGRQVTSAQMADAVTSGIGGTRGVLDSSIPTAVFLVVYIATSSNLAVSIWSALGAGVLVVALRLVRREPLRQILFGFGGVAISALLAAWTGEARDFFIWGILVNVVYGAVFAISALIGRPVVGYAAGAFTGDLSSWTGHGPARRAAMVSTWIWAGLFWLRVAVQLPLYLLGLVGPLGATRLAMGFPLFLLAGYLSYRFMQAPLAEVALLKKQDEELADSRVENPVSTREDGEPG